MARKIIVIGSGPAGIAAAQAARKQDPSSEVTVLTRDAFFPYFRIRLCDVIADPEASDKLYLHPESWYEKQGIGMQLRTEVKAVRPDEHKVVLADGRELRYDSLVAATGSRSFVPPITGSGIPGVETLWTMEEALRIEAELTGVRHAVVIGGGLLGLEAAFALAKKGIETTVIEVLPRLMTRQLDEKAAELFTAQVERQGVKVETSAVTEEIVAGPDGRVASVRLKDGRVFPAGIVFISAGVRAVLDPFKDTEIKVDRCIVTDSHLRTNLPDVYAAGDNVLLDGRWYGLWQISQAQGRVAGINAAGGDAEYQMPVPPYIINTMGTKIASAGQIFDSGQFGEYIEDVKADEENLTYQKLVYDGKKLIGYVMLGDTSGYLDLQKQL